MKKVVYSLIIFAHFGVMTDVILAANETSKIAQRFEDSDTAKAKDYLKDFLQEASSVAKQCLASKKTCYNFADIIVNKFNLQSMGQFVLGQYFRKLSEDDVKKFEALLTKYFIKAYATHERIKLFSSVDMETDDFNFKTSLNEKKTRLTNQKIFKTEKTDVNVKIVLLKKEDGHFDVFDILIEDIGLLISTRDALNAFTKDKKPAEFLKAFEESLADLK
ncbi:MAG: hypothetical protein HEEMFOPI_00802 [Holosporales bacterium]